MGYIGKLAGAVAVTLALGLPVHAVEIESDAIIGPKFERLPNKRQVLDDLVVLIRAYGWRCDRVSSARFLVFSRGFQVQCNGYAYDYEIKDRGGQWVVTLD